MLNINKLGDWRLKKQSSMQFHIWKQCIRQRETDEMMFMCLVSLVIIFLAAWINQLISDQYKLQMSVLGERLSSQITQLQVPANLAAYCMQEVELSASLVHKLELLRYLSIFVAIACISSIWCKMLTALVKQNESFDSNAAMFEGIIIFASFYLH